MPAFLDVSQSKIFCMSSAGPANSITAYASVTIESPTKNDRTTVIANPISIGY